MMNTADVVGGKSNVCSSIHGAHNFKLEVGVYLVPLNERPLCTYLLTTHALSPKG
jgi:hypothetical protein